MEKLLSNMRKVFGGKLMQFDFEHIFETVVIDADKKKKEKRAKRTRQKKNNEINPSSLGFCFRKQVLDSMGMGTEPDIRLKKIFWQGHFIHDDMVYPILKTFFEELDKQNIEVINEQWLDIKVLHKGVELNFRAYVDDVLLDHTTNEITPIEVKSIGYEFMKLTEGKMTHQIQLMCYLGLLNSKKGYLLYIFKPTLESKQFPYEYNEDMYFGILDRAVKLTEYKNAGIIPYAEAMVESEDYKEEEDILDYRVNKNLDGDYWFKKEKQCETICNYLAFCLQNKEEILPDNDINSP